jgi:hypothetical protein
VVKMSSMKNEAQFPAAIGENAEERHGVGSA